jgi:hypothetical protein
VSGVVFAWIPFDTEGDTAGGREAGRRDSDSDSRNGAVQSRDGQSGDGQSGDRESGDGQSRDRESGDGQGRDGQGRDRESRDRESGDGQGGDGKVRRCVVVAGSATHLLVRPGYSEGGVKSRDWKSVPLRHWRRSGFDQPTWIAIEMVAVPRQPDQAPVGWLSPDDWNSLW